MNFKPLKIGSLKLKSNVVAAPLAGLSSLAFRIIATELGCALAFSEMVSADGMIHSWDKAKEYLINDDSARPFGLQIFGSKAETIERAIEMIEENHSVDLIDINMGCPVKKVCKRGAGAALMKDLKNAAAIIRSARRATKKPLTVKMRSGWDDNSINCVELAKIAEDAGANAVIIHPRTREQWFKGISDWSHIAKVKAAVKIPVIGNGDINSRDDAIRMLGETGCDGVMIGRAAVGNPWIFREIVTGNACVDLNVRGKTAVRHLEILSKIMGERRAVRAMRSLLPWYTKGIPGVRAFMRDAMSIVDESELKDKLDKFFNRVDESG